MSKRTTRFYRKNEAEVMSALGLKPTKNSGAGWVEKEEDQILWELREAKKYSTALDASSLLASWVYT